MKHDLEKGNVNRAREGQVLLFDADDTLWENNVYFEQSIAAFISFVDHKVHTPEQVRQHLNSIERTTIAKNGYGLKSFRASLTRCLEDLLQTPSTAEQHRAIAGFVSHIGDHRIELLENVERTLGFLTGRHRLFLVTKGDPEEQTGKLVRSGLAPLFEAVEVLAEKDEQAYRELANRHKLPEESTWMIGNSPRSDINPALAAGLNAVLIPHEFTWVLEHEEIDVAPSHRKLLRLQSFKDLLLYF